MPRGRARWSPAARSSGSRRGCASGSGSRPSPQELYCQRLEHTWYLSERARRDVGLAVAVEDYVKKFKG
jgi:hypothetical protein